jgi:hypothetical protein
MGWRKGWIGEIKPKHRNSYPVALLRLKGMCSGIEVLHNFVEV